MTLAEQRTALQTQIDALLSKPNKTASERKQADLLMSKAAELRAQEEIQERTAALVRETRADLPVKEEDRPEYRAANIEGAFARFIRTGDSEELRTYSPETTDSGAALIPQNWAASYGQRLKAFVGLREAGATVITTKNGDPYRIPFSNDTGNNAVRIDENTTIPLSNPTFSTNELGAFSYATGLQVSNTLLRDAAFDMDAYLQQAFAKRIGRTTEQEMTVGASGGPVGVIPSISNIVTAASVSAIGLNDLIDLQNIDEGYLPTSVYMLSGATERLLKKAVGSDGRRLYPEMNEGLLLGFPYVRNASMSAPGANNFSAVFGSVKLGVTIRECVPTLLVSREKYAESAITFFALVSRQDAVVSDEAALSVLQHPAS